MSAFFKWLRRQMTIAKVVVGVLIIGCVTAVIYSERNGGLDPKMFSPLSVGKGTLLGGVEGYSVQGGEVDGSNNIKDGIGTADFHYRWQIEGKPAATDELVLDQMFKQPGIQVDGLIQRGPPGGTVKVGYKSDAGGFGVATWTVKGPADGPWVVEMTVHETLRGFGK